METETRNSDSAGTFGSSLGQTSERKDVARIPRALVGQIREVVEDPSCGYLSVEDFILQAVRKELDRVNIKLDIRRKREASQ